MKTMRIGADLAKNVFQVHAVNGRGRVVARKRLSRAQMLSYFSNLEPCLVGMEACASAHHRARVLEGFGHQARLMAPQCVHPYRKGGKNDGNGAEALGRPNMRFVAVKSVEQQAVLKTGVAAVGRENLKARLAKKASCESRGPGARTPIRARADSDGSHEGRI